MFKKVRKETSITLVNIYLYDINRQLLYSGTVYQLEIADDIVVKKSIEFFQDPEPCFIHKGAVISRIYGEIEQYIKAHFQQSGLIINVAETPFKPYLSAYNGVEYLKYDIL